MEKSLKKTLHWLKNKLNNFIKRVLIFLIKKINDNGKVKIFIIKIISKFPTLQYRLERMVKSQPLYQKQHTNYYMKGPEQLTLHARKIYIDLKREIAKQKGHD